MSEPVVPSSSATSMRMSKQARASTHPELAIRRLLHRDGFRFRVQVKVPNHPRRTIDIAFTRLRVAVFVDGCFWHVCPEHATRPTTNHAWWQAKLKRNQHRDVETNAALEAAGWLVVRIWEHEDPLTAATKVETVLRKRRSTS